MNGIVYAAGQAADWLAGKGEDVTPDQIDAQLGLPPAKTGLPTAPKTDAGFWDVAGAAFHKTQIEADIGDYSLRRRRELAQDIFRRLPPDRREDFERRKYTQTTGWSLYEYEVIREAQDYIAKNPAAAASFGDLPVGSLEDFDARIKGDLRSEWDDAQAVLDQPGGGFAEFLGGAGAMVVDPVNILASITPMGPGGAGLRLVLREAASNALAEAASLPREFRVAEELGLPDPDPLSRIAMGAMLGGGIAGAITGGARLAGFLGAKSATRREALAATVPEGKSFTEHEADVDAAEDALRGEPTVKEWLRDANQGATLPPITPDAPPNWEALRGGIFRGESGGDYDALYGFSNRPGGPFENVKLTEMTVDEAIAFSDPNGPYGQWVNAQIGRVATPMGAYQIVGKTLRAAKAGLGLRGDELMTPELQERLGHYIYRTQGTGAWEGYAGPDAGFRPGDGASYQGGGRTSRGYTGSDQIAAGDMRIGVEYAVVDASLLKKASGRFQPRDRGRSNSALQIADMAARLDPEQLMPSPNAATGTPIIGPDMMVESGNGRVAAIGRAYELHPDRAAAYRARIEAAGFEIPEGVERPVLVARRTTALDDAGRERFAIEAQDAGVARMTPTEIARTSARAMTADRLARFRPEAALGDAENRDFLQSILSALPASERNALFDPSGALNAEGRRRLSGAFFARAWDDGGPLGREIVGRFAELEDPGELKSLIDALEEAAPAWATLRAEIEAGSVRPEFDITPHVLDALNVIVMARRDAGRLGGTIAEAVDAILAQGDMFAATNPLSVALLRKFWRDGRAAPAADIARFLQRYADEARAVGRSGDMLGASPAEALRAIDATTFADLPDDIPPVARAPEPPPEDPNLPETAYADGATSPEAEVADAAELATARAELGEMTFTDATGAQVRAADLLDDIEADQTLIDVIDACMIGGGRT
jgi:hypothetical protein